MRYNNGSEAAMQRSLNGLFQSLNSGQITWRRKLSINRLSVGELRIAPSGPELGQERDGCDSGHRENLCNLCVSSDQTLIWSGETLVISVRFRQKEVYSKCAGQLAVFVAGSRAGNSSVLDLCLFINMWVLDMPCTVCPTLVLSSGRAPRSLDERPSSYPNTHYHVSVWTLLLRRRRMTTS